MLFRGDLLISCNCLSNSKSSCVLDAMNSAYHRYSLNTKQITIYGSFLLSNIISDVGATCGIVYFYITTTR